jgi:predicted tellurium resistance membrane protein TerC
MHIADFATLGMLVLLQAVLGIDNLLYISLESKRAPEADRIRVRHVGITIAIALRIALLFALVQLVKYVQDPILELDLGRAASGSFSIHSLIVLGGGVFILYTAMKEIWHMLRFEDEGEEEVQPDSVRTVITMIVIMNIVFSFDSILSAMALTEVFWVMAAAIVISGVIMMWLSDRVSDFLQRNRAYEVLGLFILFIVGIMLLSEGGHLAHLHLAGHVVTPMSKATFYFVIGILVVVDVVQTRYQRRLLATKK